MPLSLLLINPNTSDRATEMMLAVARPLLGDSARLRGITASRGARMILSEADIAVAAQEVVRIGPAETEDTDCVVIGAFGNPGLDELRHLVACEVIGIGEAAVLEAAAGGRRFGIATTTPDLETSIIRGVEKLSLANTFVGVRVTQGDPLALLNDPAAQHQALYEACADLFELDGAEAVVIGGGPLSDSAAILHKRFGDAIVQPLPAAMRLCLHRTRAT